MGSEARLRRMTSKIGRKVTKRPVWRAVYLVGPVWCGKCGKSIHNDSCWERDEPHIRAGKFRCQEPQCHPDRQDYK